MTQEGRLRLGKFPTTKGSPVDFGVPEGYPLTTFLGKIQEAQKRPIDSEAKTFLTIPLCSDARTMVIASHVSGGL